MKKEKSLKFGIVNTITFTRVLGSIILPIVYFTKGVEAVVFFVILVFLTDAIDGKLSRLWKVESFFGGILDSVADKLFAFVMLGLLSYKYPGMIFVMIFEFGIFLTNTLAFAENKNVQTSRIGKLKTIILDTSVSIMFVYASKSLYLKYLSKGIQNFVNISEYPVSHVLVGVIVGMELITIADYGKKRVSQVSDKKIEKKKLKKFKEIWELLIDREFYIKHKDERLKKFLYEE